MPMTKKTATKRHELALSKRVTKSSKALSAQVGGNHYKELKIQPAVYNHVNGIGFIEGSVIKYISRWKMKGGVQDLKKAKHFIEMLIELEE